MHGHRIPLRVTAIGLLLAVAAACTSAAPRGPEDRSVASASAPSASAPSASASTPVPTASAPPTASGLTSVRVQPSSGGSLLVRGRFPHVASSCVDVEQPSLTARLPGSLRIVRSDDGTLALTVTLSFERYLEGIAEVPPTWPREALEAQAIAARSYALATTGWTGEEGATLDEPICATTACQVYRGIPVPREPAQRRWVAAVRRTAGEVLLHDGRPATTVYFSTSNGHTYGNEDVFGSAPLPYLRPVTEQDDGASPTSRWRVRLPFRDLARFLREADRWPKGRRIAAARSTGDAVLLRGRHETRTITLGDLRDAVNVWAPCLEPHRYPGALPLTVPSRWAEASAQRDALILSGRGWGHGVGMVQWGAYGKARRGASASDILAYYYGGLRPQPYPEPGLIHVEIASGLRMLRIVPSRSGATLGGRPLAGPAVITAGDTLEVRRIAG